MPVFFVGGAKLADAWDIFAVRVLFILLDFVNGRVCSIVVLGFIFFAVANTQRTSSKSPIRENATALFFIFEFRSRDQLLSGL